MIKNINVNNEINYENNEVKIENIIITKIKVKNIGRTLSKFYLSKNNIKNLKIEMIDIKGYKITTNFKVDLMNENMKKKIYLQKIIHNMMQILRMMQFLL